MRLDWQTLITLAIGLVAALYLARRWWPGLRGLFASQTSAHAGPGCPSGSPDQVAAPAASCSSGCGNCGHQAPPAKDHRIQIIRTRQG